MLFRPSRSRIIAAILILALLLTSMTALAQVSARLRASKPQIEDFPRIKIFLSLTDSEGRSIPNLPPSSFTVIEDGTPVNEVEITEHMRGTRQIFVINSTRGLRGRDALGMTRYDYVRASLNEWWKGQAAAELGMDDLTLITIERSLVVHSPYAAELASTLSQHEPSFEDELASFDILLSAFEFVTDPSTSPGISNSIFFITPFISELDESPIQNTIAMARESGTTIYPILVGPEEILDFSQVDNLRLLAEATGGEMIFFDPEEGLGSLAERVLSQRMQYQVRYISLANSSGSHSVRVRVAEDGLDVLSDLQEFEIDIAPPEVNFLLLPEQITRETEDPSQAIDTIPPLNTTIQVQISFPDDHPREITSTRLLVDGETAEVNSRPPFDLFSWDLSTYIETGSHTLQVIAEDSLALEGASPEMAVQLIVRRPPRGLTSLQPALGTIAAIFSVLAIGLFLGIVIFSVSRRRKAQAGAPGGEVRQRSEEKTRASLRGKLDTSMIEGELVPVTRTANRVQLIGKDVVLGRDSSLSAVHLDDPSVEGLHARLTRLANGHYLVRDQGSIAGTWVNYQPVPEEGQTLRHGDLLHLGRVVYRFHRRDHPIQREILINPVQPSQEVGVDDLRGNQEGSR
jgi:hypothetical protein